jgi:hemerythrin-like metal-binding protein
MRAYYPYDSHSFLLAQNLKIYGESMIQLRISAKLLLAFTALNLFLIGIGVFVFIATTNVAGSYDDTARSTSNELKVKSFQSHLYKTRTFVWAALATGEPQKWELAEKSAHETTAIVNALEGSIQNPERLALLKKVKAELSTYIGELKNIKQIGGLNENLNSAQAKEYLNGAAVAAEAIDNDGNELAAKFEIATQDRNAVLSKIIYSMHDDVAVLSAIAVFLGFLFSVLIARGISRPIKKMVSAMGQLAKGDLSVVVPCLDRKDEIGEMADAVEIFKENAVQIEALRRDQEKAAARSAQERKKATEEMAQHFEEDVLGIVKSVSQAAKEMKSVASGMSDSAQKSAAQAANVAAAATQTTSNVQTVASAAEELSASIQEISGQVIQASHIASTASDETHKTNEIIQSLSSAVGNIGSVVQLINDIASQTNLLALNATIEAARAGEAGKGFAVVASEVKNLANQTSKATEDISVQIAEVQNGTQNAVSAIQNIGGIIEKVRSISSSIAAAVEEQGAATQEIARNVQQASQGTIEVSNAIEQVKLMADATGASSSQVLSSAGELSNDSQKLHDEVLDFIKGLREDKNNNVLMEWNENLKTGIDSIDAQHRKLVDMLNQLYDGFQKGLGRKVVGIVLDGLISYTSTHFKFEEDIFDRTGYAETPQHKKEHAALVDKVLKVQESFRTDPNAALSEEVMVFLRNWLTNHIMGTDKRYVPHMKSKGIA